MMDYPSFLIYNKFTEVTMKYENEITVEVSISISELINLLTKQKFKLVEEYDVIDNYMVNNNYINYNDPLILLSNSILIRNVITNTKNKKIITYKHSFSLWLYKFKNNHRK